MTGNVITVLLCVVEHSIKNVSTIKYRNRIVVWISQKGRTQANNTRRNSSSSTVLPIQCQLRVDFWGMPKSFQVHRYRKEQLCGTPNKDSKEQELLRTSHIPDAKRCSTLSRKPLYRSGMGTLWTPLVIHKIITILINSSLVISHFLHVRANQFDNFWPPRIYHKLYPLLWMIYQFIPIFLVEFKFLHDFFIENTKKWEILINLIFQS